MMTSRVDNKLEMATAITDIFTKHGTSNFDDLPDDRLLDYAEVIWEIHGDLRDEWSRRQMMKAAVSR